MDPKEEEKEEYVEQTKKKKKICCGLTALEADQLNTGLHYLYDFLCGTAGACQFNLSDDVRVVCKENANSVSGGTYRSVEFERKKTGGGITTTKKLRVSTSLIHDEESIDEEVTTLQKPVESENDAGTKTGEKRKPVGQSSGTLKRAKVVPKPAAPSGVKHVSNFRFVREGILTERVLKAYTGAMVACIKL